MEEKRQHYGFSGSDTQYSIVACQCQSSVSAGSGDKNSDSEWNGYRTVLFVWAV